MIIKSEIITNLEINNLEDLKKIKSLEENSNLKVNKSALAREMGVDRRTIDKYISGYVKPTNRTKNSSCDDYYQVIKELLSDKNRVFVYKSVLYRYLQENHQMKVPRTTFERYIRKHDELNNYFNEVRNTSVSGPAVMRYET